MLKITSDKTVFVRAGRQENESIVLHCIVDVNTTRQTTIDDCMVGLTDICR